MRRVCVLILIAVSAASCTSGSSSPSSLQTLTNPNAELKTENFTGTVDVGGTAINLFTVTTGGQTASITLTAAGPPATIYMGLGVGSYGDGICSLFSTGITVVPAGTTPQLSGSISAGNYCVAVFDAGNQSGPVDFAVTVAHY